MEDYRNNKRKSQEYKDWCSARRAELAAKHQKMLDRSSSNPYKDANSPGVEAEAEEAERALNPEDEEATADE